MINWLKLGLSSQTAITYVIILTVLLHLMQSTHGFRPREYQHGEARKLFGGYRITPKHCRATKTLPVSDPRSTGPTICMFNHECAQRSGEVVGACMDGFLFGACCQIARTDEIIESTLLMDAQNNYYQQQQQQQQVISNAAAAAQSYQQNYGGSQVASQQQHQQDSSVGLSMSIEQQQSDSQELDNDAGNQGNIHASQTNTIQETAASNFYVEKDAVSISSQQPIEDFVMMSSSTSAPSVEDNRLIYTSEMPTKISTSMIEMQASGESNSFEEAHTAVQNPVILQEGETIKSNYSHQQVLQMDVSEFTHSDITHPGAETVLLENDMQMPTGFGPEEVYVTLSSNQESQYQAKPSTAAKPVPGENQYILVETISHDQMLNERPATGSTTSSGITTNIDSIESIILMLNNTNHGPSYNINNNQHDTSSSYGTQKPQYGSTNSLSASTNNKGQNYNIYVSTQGPNAAGMNTFIPVTTIKPVITSGSGHIVSSTSSPMTHYQEIETKRPGDLNQHDIMEQEMQHYEEQQNQQNSGYLETLTSVSDKQQTYQISSDSGLLQNGYPSFGSSQVQAQAQATTVLVPVHDDHTDPASNYSDFNSPLISSKPTSEFNKMPGVGSAYPVDMSLFEEEELNLLDNIAVQQSQSHIQNNLASLAAAGYPQSGGNVASNNQPTKQTAQQTYHKIPSHTEAQAIPSLTHIQVTTVHPNVNEKIDFGPSSQANKVQANIHNQRPQQTVTTSLPITSARPNSDRQTTVRPSTTVRPPTTRPPSAISTIFSTSRPVTTESNSSPNRTVSYVAISTTSRPLVISSSSLGPINKRPTTKPSIQDGKIPQVPLHNQDYHIPSISNDVVITPTGFPVGQTQSDPTQKKPSTSYITGPTSPRPPTTFSHQEEESGNVIANEKIDIFVSSTTGSPPIYLSTYAAPAYDSSMSSVHIHHVQQTPQNHYNKPTFVKIPSATQRPPSPTVLITPKPTVVNVISSSTWAQKPNSSTAAAKYPSTTPMPSFSSTSYVFSPLVTRRPEYQINTPEYVSLPTITSNDFDDPGYYGVQNTQRPAYPQVSSETTNGIPSDDRPAFPGYYGPTPSYPAFAVPGAFGEKVETIVEEEETYTSPNDFVNFPPVRNPNLNMSAVSSSVTSDFGLSTPAFVEDVVLKDKMNTLVSKIVESLQGNFEALAEMIDEGNNTAAGLYADTTAAATTFATKKPTVPTRKSTARPASSVRPNLTTRKPVTRLSTTATKPTTRRPVVTTRKPIATTRRPTTKKTATRKPTRKVTITTTTAAIISQDEFVNEQDEGVDVDEGENEIDQDDEAAGRKFQCGVRPHVKSGRIVGGKGSSFGAFPWQVLVRESTWLGLFTKNKCGGVLITNKYIVTAAHCQPGFLASLVAVMGEFDISGDLESKRSVTKNVKRVIVHRQYDAATFENDLALLELESPVHYDTHIVPICMPQDTADFTGRMATVTGWGRLKYGGGVPSVLQEVQVPIIENSVCQEMFNTAGHNKKILSSFLCAGYANGQKDSCEGDSGGPLVLQRSDGRYELAGTVSHGIKCAAPYLPGVYMRTTFYKPWLRSITGVK